MNGKKKRENGSERDNLLLGSIREPADPFGISLVPCQHSVGESNYFKKIYLSLTLSLSF